MYPPKNSPNLPHNPHTRSTGQTHTPEHHETAEYLRLVRIIPLAILLLLCIALAGTASADTLTAGTFDELHTAISTAPTDGSVRTILITQDIPVGSNTSDIFTIAAKQNITLTTDAAPHKIYRTGAQTGGNGMFLVTGGNLTLKNNGTAGILTLDGNRTGVPASITSMIYLNNSGTFTMDGGIITANHADNYGGGGVHNDRSTFIMSGGTITENNARYYGGGVYNAGTFTMTGGTISENTANYGGGVYNLGDAAVSGGTITSNSAATEGGEVCYLFGTFNLSGNVQIGPDTTMLFGGDANYITVPSAFTGNVANITPFRPHQTTISHIEDLYINGTDIHPPLPLDLAVSPGTKIVQLPQDATAADLNNFRLSPSLPGFALAYQDDSSSKSLILTRGYNLTVTGGTGSGSYATGTNVSVSAIVPAGQTFENWTANVSSGSFENPDSPVTTYTMPAEDVAITARFKITSTPLPTATVTTTPTTIPPTRPVTQAPTATQTPGESSSSGGNMDNAFRVLFDTNGGSSISPETGLSYGDRITQPADPVKTDAVFLGWYKDTALITRWNFSAPIPGDMTLYAGWAPVEPSVTNIPTTAAATSPTLPTVSASATISPTVQTTAADTIPTLTQAPSPISGLLPALIAAGILLRKRHP